MRGLGEAAGAGLAMGVVFGRVGVPSLAAAWPAAGVVIVALLVGIGVELVWRKRMRPSAAWNDGGVSCTTESDVAQLTWDQVGEIDQDGSRVKLRHGEEDSYQLVLARARNQRSSDDLLKALRDSRQRSLATRPADRPDPPWLPYPRRPLMLWVIWLAETSLLSTVLLLLIR